MIKQSCTNIVFDVRREDAKAPRCIGRLRLKGERAAAREAAVCVTVVALSHGNDGQQTEAQRQKIKTGMRLVQINGRQVRMLSLAVCDDLTLALHQLILDEPRPMTLKFESPLKEGDELAIEGDTDRRPARCTVA